MCPKKTCHVPLVSECDSSFRVWGSFAVCWMFCVSSTDAFCVHWILRCFHTHIVWQSSSECVTWNKVNLERFVPSEDAIPLTPVVDKAALMDTVLTQMRQCGYVRWLTLQFCSVKRKQPKIMLASDLEAQHNTLIPPNVLQHVRALRCNWSFLGSSAPSHQFSWELGHKV